MSVVVTAEYKTFLKEIKERIYKAQYDALKAVNKELIDLYWDMGRSIVGEAGCAWLGQGNRGDPGERFAKGVSGDTRVFRKESLEFCEGLTVEEVNVEGKVSK